jgi:hypothetical protein
VYRAYEKRINKIPKLLEGMTVDSSKARLDMMAKEVEETIEKRN